MAAEHVERIAERMRARRDELGLTRKKLVQRMQGLVTENDIYRWEKGKHRPNDETLQEIARALEVDTSYFFLEELPDARNANAPDLLASLNGVSQLDRIEQQLAHMEAMLNRLVAAAGGPPPGGELGRRAEGSPPTGPDQPESGSPPDTDSQPDTG